jgi:hypothetical protein
LLTSSLGLRQGDPAFITVVCGGYEGVELDVECDYEPWIIDRIFRGDQG